jgi:hypothetical protein
MPIVGTANFDPAEVEFYKIELGIPQEGSNEIQWVTLGDTHNTPVVNGTLEMFHAAGLPPGDYFLRLIVVKDSNYVGEPHTIQVIPRVEDYSRMRHSFCNLLIITFSSFCYLLPLYSILKVINT